jgi:hypothetical protein
VGRFTQRDPIGAQAQEPISYVYAKNNPITKTDPSGLWSSIPSRITTLTGYLNTCIAGGVPGGWGANFLNTIFSTSCKGHTPIITSWDESWFNKFSPTDRIIVRRCALAHEMSHADICKCGGEKVFNMYKKKEQAMMERWGYTEELRCLNDPDNPIYQSLEDEANIYLHDVSEFMHP